MNLRKLYLWVQEPLDRMKWLALIIDSIKSLKGGAICSAINTFALNGSPSTRQFINRILKEASAPILTISSYVSSFLQEEISNNGLKVNISGVGADELFGGYYQHHIYFLNDMRGKKTFS